ncbi:DUF2142 domain-containing protein, partial [Methanobrevibacter sp.]|uniref:DUF2142 domain-containing protein n=1 Tax=Methanobrevibacter sp. TaxID=66852 RepID=UPI00388F61FB
MYFIITFISVLFSGSLTSIHYKFVDATIIFSIILGFLCLLYYFNHKNELHKVAFLTIISFGIICALITPIFAPPDEVEHFVRSLLTSQGNLFPHYVQIPANVTALNISGLSIDSTIGFFDLYFNINQIFFNANVTNIPINNAHAYFYTGFLHNPFYGYLAQGFGILLANVLNLNNIWMLWLGRICNLILYAIFISIAVKKTPIFKIPMLFMALVPLAIYQGSSMSIDATVNGLGFIVVSYFLYLYKSKEKSISSKELIIFSILVLLLSLTKVTYLVFILLLLCIPKDKFKINYYYIFFPIAIISALVLIWSSNTTPINDFSRQGYYIMNNINSTNQISYIINHPNDSIISFLYIIPNVFEILIHTFTFYVSTDLFTSDFLLYVGLISFIFVVFLYPIKEKIPLKYKIIGLMVLVINFFGTCFVQLLKWTPVGQLFPILGVQPRYFIPLFVILIFVFNFNFNYKKIEEWKINNILMIISISLLISLISTILFKFY